MNKRLDVAAKVLFSQAISSDDTGANKKTLAECREEAATMLVACDMVMFAPETVQQAIAKAGFDSSEYLQPFLSIIKELNSMEVDTPFFLSDMEKAWARGHENGFWDARQSDARKPEPVAPIERKAFFTEADVQTAEAQGYVSGWFNGILSNSDLPSEAGEMLLLGAEHGKANNPYSVKAVNEGADNA